jgi:hypothetical protein
MLAIAVPRLIAKLWYVGGPDEGNFRRARNYLRRLRRRRYAIARWGMS